MTSIIFEPIDLAELVASDDFEENATWWLKTGRVKIESATPGQRYDTILEGDLLEMTAVATEDDVLVTHWDSPAREHYLLREVKVPDNYVQGEGDLWHNYVQGEGDLWLPKEGEPPVRVIFTQTNVVFTTSWGAENFRVLAGGALLEAGYGIQPITFQQTYKQCTPDGEILTLT
jgi:hypothetical protein